MGLSEAASNGMMESSLANSFVRLSWIWPEISPQLLVDFFWIGFFDFFDFFLPFPFGHWTKTVPRQNFSNILMYKCPIWTVSIRWDLEEERDTWKFQIEIEGKLLCEKKLLCDLRFLEIEHQMKDYFSEFHYVEYIVLDFLEETLIDIIVDFLQCAKCQKAFPKGQHTHVELFSPWSEILLFQCQIVHGILHSCEDPMKCLNIYGFTDQIEAETIVSVEFHKEPNSPE